MSNLSYADIEIHDATKGNRRESRSETERRTVKADILLVYFPRHISFIFISEANPSRSGYSKFLHSNLFSVILSFN